MDSTLALGAFRIARGAGGEAVDPSCWPIFGFRNLLGASRGAEGSFLCSLITDFLAEGAGWGASPGRGGELGCQAQQVLKKIVRLASVFPSPPFRSSDCVLIDYRLWAAKSEGRQ